MPSKRLRLQNIRSIIHAISRSVISRAHYISCRDSKRSYFVATGRSQRRVRVVSCMSKCDSKKRCLRFVFHMFIGKNYTQFTDLEMFFLYKGFSLNFIKCRISQKKVRFTYKDDSIAEADDWWRTKKWLLIAKMAFVRNTNRTRWAESCDRDGEEDLDKHFGWTLRVKN